MFLQLAPLWQIYFREERSLETSSESKGSVIWELLGCVYDSNVGKLTLVDSLLL